MKHLLNGVAIAALLAIAGPAWAQQQAVPNPTPNPSGNSMGVPGPNPGGPGLTPYTGGGYATQPTTSAMPPAHHPVHHVRAMHAHHKAMASKAAMAGDTTAALNREELARINSGNMSSPMPAAPMPEGPPPEGAPPSAGSSKYLPTGGPKLH
jgi:hypothetical protein